jgi:hypothetical protein
VSRGGKVRVVRGSGERGVESVGQREVAEGFFDVEADLGAEEVGRVKAALGAKAMEEGHLERGGFGEVDGVEVEEMGFDGEGVGAEGGAVADVGDASEEGGRGA